MLEAVFTLTILVVSSKALLVYGSLLVSIFTLSVAMSLAELAGAYPTSGGLCDATFGL
jgi:amino acid transporter